MKPKLAPLGDSALLIQFGNEINLEINQRVHALDALLRASSITGIIETVPAYSTLLIHYDPLAWTFAQLSDWVNAEIDRVESNAARKPRRIEVPVRYGGASGPDLEWVAAHHKLSITDIVHLHAAQTYTVYMMGFTPGFPYMGKLHPSLVTPRMDSPRTLVRAGSVAITGKQTGIYPIDSPGGWRVIGWTPLRLFDLSCDSPFLFSPGDEVRFTVEAMDA
ncbi:MAG TPA: 5-oxoprolinase subunit PxpB [Anaerolineales bacterium]